MLRKLATGAVTYSVSLLGRTVPHFLFAPVPEFRVINVGAPAIRIGQDGTPVGREIAAGEVLYEGPAYMLAFSTIPYWGFGARIFPYAEERQDRFDLRIVSFGSFAAVTNVRAIWRGTYTSDRLHDFLVDRVRIECERATPLQIGGDVVGMRTRDQRAPLDSARSASSTTTPRRRSSRRRCTRGARAYATARTRRAARAG